MTRTDTRAALYVLFAGLAISINIFSQWLSLALYGGPAALPTAIGVGTATGLIAKYLLDKRWIFLDRTNSLQGHVSKFTGYTLTGVATTALFWGTEIAFNMIPPAGHWRYLGAALGLVAGYALKFRLDSRFVFRKTSE